jgi:uncharacterized protein
MKTINFVVFFSIAIAIYGLANYYIFIRGWQALPKSPIRTAYLIAFLFFSLSFIIGRFAERAAIGFFSDILVWFGSFWLALMVYFLIAVILIDVVRLANHFIGFFPNFITANIIRVRAISFITVFAGVSALVFYGYINALSPRVKTLELKIENYSMPPEGINIVMVSDIHLGTIVGSSRLKPLVEKVNAIEPDVVLLVGDILDEDLKPVIKDNPGELLKQLKSKYGVYAVTGNHEFFGGVDAACKYLREHDIVVLRNQEAIIANSFYIVGRDDIMSKRYMGGERPPLSMLVKNLDKNIPVILWIINRSNSLRPKITAWFSRFPGIRTTRNYGRSTISPRRFTRSAGAI